MPGRGVDLIERSCCVGIALDCVHKPVAHRLDASGSIGGRDTRRRVARLGPGSPFGETALVENLHRNASVVSEGYSTGYQLNKDDFDKLRSKYPDFDRQVREVVEARKQRQR